MAKKEKMCIVCGKEFVGNAHAETCSAGCRKKLSRMKAKGETPPYSILAKSKAKKKPDEKKEEAVKKESDKADVPDTKTKKDDSGGMPDPKKDRGAYSKWMRDHKHWTS